MTTKARENLDKIISRTQALGPVLYGVEIPGNLAIQLNYLAIRSSLPIEELIVKAIEDYCYVEMMLLE